MEPENTPLEKENPLPGCKTFKGTYTQEVVVKIYFSWGSDPKKSHSF